jgi:RTX calcium-binding nonapeptide repeat (4 copies)
VGVKVFVLGKKLLDMRVLVCLGVTLALMSGVAAAATKRGDNRPNVISGTAARDVILGLGGNDKLYGGGGNDQMYGGAGRDWLYGGSGNDVLFARDGAPDVVACGRGLDRAVADRIDLVDSCERLELPADDDDDDDDQDDGD